MIEKTHKFLFACGPATGPSIGGYESNGPVPDKWWSG